MAVYKGLDISSWQVGIDLSAWKDALGLSFVILKVGGNEGGRYSDGCFDGFYRQAKALGLHVGAYYYTSTTDALTARGDAEHMLGLLDGYDLDMPCYMDVEDERQLGLGARALTDVIRSFCDRVNEGGRYAGIYTGGSAWLGSMCPDELLCYANWIAWWADFDGIEEVRDRCGDVGMWQVGGISIGGHVEYGDVAGHLDYDLCCIEYWDRIGGVGTPAPESAPSDHPSPQQMVLDLIRGEVGYVPTDGKHNKYAQYLDGLGDVYNTPKDGFDWCDIFSDYPFYRLFGKESAARMLNQPLGGCGAGCPYSADYFAGMGRFDDVPEVAAPIFFGERGDEYHVGMVEGYDDTCVYTIEGNTGYSEGYDGGAVMRRTCPRNDRRISGYGHPDWSVVGGEDTRGQSASYTPAPRNNRDGGKLDVDGDGGWNTVVDWQHQMGTREDGVVSGQDARDDQWREQLLSLDYVGDGSALMVEVGKLLVSRGYDLGPDGADGLWGWWYSGAIQQLLADTGYYDGEVDHRFGCLSMKGLQRSLNDGRWREWAS